MTRRDVFDVAVVTTAAFLLFGPLGLVAVAVGWGGWVLVRHADEIGVE